MPYRQNTLSHVVALQPAALSTCGNRFAHRKTNIALGLRRFPSDPAAMSSGELLNIHPQELQFPFELRKQISCSLQLSNKTDNYVAFKVKTTNPKKYCVIPNTGVVLPGSTCDVIVIMQAQKEAPHDMQCKDKFLLQSIVASHGATAKDITPEMFNKESGHGVEKCKLRVVYVAPSQPPSSVQEGSVDSSPRASVSENGRSSTSEFTVTSNKPVRPLISKVTEERNSIIEQNKRLRQEQELLRNKANRGRGGQWRSLTEYFEGAT